MNPASALSRRPGLRRVGTLAAILLTLLGGSLIRAKGAAPTDVPPPTPPPPVSPVAVFRQLLALPDASRDETLSKRSPAQRELLRARLAEYQALPAEKREERLVATDLYWHLQQLIRREPARREPLLAAAPADLRPVLEERLAVWDRLPESDRRILQDQDHAIRYFARWKVLPAAPPLPGPSLSRSPAVSLRLQGELARLQDLPPAQRERVVENWRQFFEAPGARGERALKAMSESEREEMQTVLRRFRSLPPNQRQTCIDSFARLANLPASERADFLRRAERWEALDPAERATWRRLVTLLPPLPPASAPEPATAPATPPLPPAPPRRALLTNANPPA
jgi:hypothetical protein